MPLDRLSAEDVRILELEAGNVRGHTCKLLVLERGPTPLPTVDDLRAHIGARLDAAPWLRRRLVPTPLRLGSPVWIDDPGFDIARHVRPVAEPRPVSLPRLREIMAGLMEAMEDGAMALIWRIHHCMADGTTAMRLGREVLWSALSSSVAAAVAQPRR